MDNEEKFAYASYVARIGGYYRGCAKYQQAIQYYIKAKKILNEVKGYEFSKCNLFFILAVSYINIGDLQEAEKNIQVMEDMFNKDLVDKADKTTLYAVKAKLLFAQGKYNEALNEINSAIDICIENGMNPQDLFLTGTYLIKIEILNSLSQYQNAYFQAEQVYNMNKLHKKEEHQVFGRIFTEMSREELGLGKAKKALEYAEKAKTIFINDASRPNKNITTSVDTELAKAYVVEGDALVALGENEKAVESYATAEVIYYNNYRENMKNVDEVSKMYLAATKAACKLPNKHWYSKFHNRHMEKFGAEHPRSIEILNLKCYD